MPWESAVADRAARPNDPMPTEPPAAESPLSARRRLSAGRLRRLLDISGMVRRNPRLNMAEILDRLAISRSQFYRDRQELRRLGFTFGRRGRAKNSFFLDQDLLLPPVAISVSELLLLSSAVAALAHAGHAETAYLGLRSLLALVARLPEEVGVTLLPYVEEVAVAEGFFGCRLELLDALVEAIQQRRRVVIQRAVAASGEAQNLREEDPAREETLSQETLSIDPHRLAAGPDGRLRIEGFWVERNLPVAVPLTDILQVGLTPFFSAPEPKGD
ncbi:MAG: hypothetical protein V2A77_03170 [Pseudomonadota bacterium]